ncbi:hypothetical protein BGX23_006730 [Mortierella sp. AD031]|nr:hypothetical protein BGX23_006730 [Mortierella sp. AD031]KAG0216637.1 hypothetical protein BGX33_012392 [Mortierella sp. NVP41]
MSNYGTNNHSHRDEENAPLLNGQPVVVVEETTIFGRTFRHVHHHRKRYFALWVLAAISAISVVLGLYYFHKNSHHEGGNTGDFKKDKVCESDRSYPIAILLSIFFGYVGIDRFYLGYIISALLKLATAGGLGIWYIIDIILICIGALPDHNGCSLVAP